MDKKLEARVSRLERLLYNKNERKKQTNEMAPAIAAVGRLLLKNLPIILRALPDLITLFKNESNKDKVDTLIKFSEAAQQVSDMVKEMKV